MFPSLPPPGYSARRPRRFSPSPTWPPSPARSYQQTLGRLERDLGADQRLGTLSVDQLTTAVTAACGGRAPATWNRHVATVRFFFGFCRRAPLATRDLTVDLERRPDPADRPNAPLLNWSGCGATRT